MKTAIVMGVGADRGVGAQLCRRFAGLGLHVIAAGRTGERLEALAQDIRESGGSAEAFVADATSEADTRALFEAAGDRLDLAIYNAGNNMPGRIDEMEADFFEKCWRVVCYGAFLFGREAVRNWQDKGSGTLLFTGASASMRGRANFGAFTAAKGGLRNLAQAMAKEYGPEGIHVAHVIVDGVIDGDMIAQRYPEYAEALGEAGMVSIDGIVDGYQFLYQQGPRAWSFELDLRTAIENW